MPNFTLDVNWLLVQELDAIARYKLSDNWTAFASYADREEPYHTNDLPSRYRLFFREHRAELGLCNFSKFGGVQLAAGYAFARSFSFGFDERDLNTVSDVRSEPYVRVGLNLRLHRKNANQ